MIGLVALTMAATLVACGGGNEGGSENGEGGTTADGQVTIDFFHRWPNEPKNTFFAELVAEFEAQNPDIKVNVESVLNDAYKDKIKVVAGSENSPDVMFSWSGTFIKELVDGGNVMSLNAFLAENPDVAERYYESQMLPFNFEGEQYALPVGMHAKLFFYDADSFAELGVEAPETWNEFIQLLETIEATGTTPIEFGAQEQWPIAHYIGTLNQRVLDPDVFYGDMDPATGTFEDPGYITALERLLEIVKFANDDLTAVGHEIARESWVGGSSPIMYMQSAEIGLFEGVQFDFGTFNFPAVEGGKGDPAQLTGAPEGFFVAANTDQPEASLRFLEFILNKENGIAYTEQTGELSAVIGAVEEADVSDAQKQSAQEIINASAMTTWLDNAYDPQIVQAYLAEAQMMIGGQQTPEGVMAAVQEAAARVRAEQ